MDCTKAKKSMNEQIKDLYIKILKYNWKIAFSANYPNNAVRIILEDPLGPINTMYNLHPRPYSHLNSAHIYHRKEKTVYAGEWKT